MHNKHNTNELEMSRFGEYLLKSRVVAEKYATYYVRWVRKFMAQVPERDGLNFEDRLAAFLDTLKPSVEPWQLQQAEQAVRLYFSHYLTLSGAEKAITEIKPDASGYISKVDVMDTRPHGKW